MKNSFSQTEALISSCTQSSDKTYGKGKIWKFEFKLLDEMNVIFNYIHISENL